MNIIEKLGIDIPAIKKCVDREYKRSLEYVDDMDRLLGNKLTPALQSLTIEDLDTLIDTLPSDGFYRSELRVLRSKKFGNHLTESEQNIQRIKQYECKDQ